MTNKQRRMPARSGTYIATATLLGVLLAFSWVWIWRDSVIEPVQGHLLGLYISTSIPIPTTMKSEHVARYWPTAARQFPKSSQIPKKLIAGNLKWKVYENKGLLEFVAPVFEGAAIILFVSILVGLFLRALMLRRMREWQHLRGPQFKTLKQMNKRVKGDALYLNVEDFKPHV
jgi:hypothetical protein